MPMKATAVHVSVERASPASAESIKRRMICGAKMRKPILPKSMKMASKVNRPR
jgi:hypothetical protein